MATVPSPGPRPQLERTASHSEFQRLKLQSPTFIVSKADRDASTSPYIYFEVPYVAAFDGCTLVGSTYTNVRTSLLPQDVSSIIPQDISCFGAVLGLDGSNSAIDLACPLLTQQFNFGDLPCPPQSLRDWGSSSYIYDPKNHYLPFISAWPGLTELDSAWGTCKPLVG